MGKGEIGGCPWEGKEEKEETGEKEWRIWDLWVTRIKKHTYIRKMKKNREMQFLSF